MRIDIITIFPDYFTPLDLSLIGKARRSGLIDVRLHDLRRWTYDRHHTVDDTPYGGGPGMVMKPEPWGEALDEITADADAGTPRLILPTPSGLPFTQQDAVRLAKEPWLIFACGRYEGIDARVAVDAAQRMPVEELSIGDYVLNGGRGRDAGDRGGDLSAAARRPRQCGVHHAGLVRAGDDGQSGRGTGLH